MLNKKLEKRLQKIEKEGNDDLNLILEFGPQNFPTYELHRLLYRLEEQSEKVFALKRACYYAAFVILASSLAGTYCLINGMQTLGFIFLTFLPLSIGVAAVGFVHMSRRYSTYRYTGYLRSQIAQEIERRRKDASIY